MLKPLASKFRPDLSVRFKDIAEKHVPGKLKPIVGNCQEQGCGVGAGVGVARSRGKEPGVGVDQTASTPTPERFVGICDKLQMQGKICMYILEIICTDIVFEFCRFTHND